MVATSSSSKLVAVVVRDTHVRSEPPSSRRRIRYSGRRGLDRRVIRPTIRMMRFVVTFATVWATAIVPQLCRIGALTTCCVGEPHRQRIPEMIEVCAPSGCVRDCQQPGEEPTTPVERNCGACENICGAVVKPASAGERSSQLPGKLPAGQPAAFGCDKFPTGWSTQRPPPGTSDLPRLPRPSSDFPLRL